MSLFAKGLWRSSGARPGSVPAAKDCQACVDVASEFPAWGVALFLIPSPAFAQKIPDSIVWAAAAVFASPLLAVPLKRLIAKRFGEEISVRRLWGLCASDWLLWIPGPYLLFVNTDVTGTGIGLVVFLALSAWLHRAKELPKAGLAVGLILALLTPAMVLAVTFAALSY